MKYAYTYALLLGYSLLFFNLVSMQTNNKQENDSIEKQQLLELAKTLKRDFSLHKKNLPFEVIQELEMRITTAYYATLDNPPLDYLHSYLTNAQNYLNENIKDDSNILHEEKDH